MGQIILYRTHDVQKANVAYLPNLWIALRKTGNGCGFGLNINLIGKPLAGGKRGEDDA